MRKVLIPVAVIALAIAAAALGGRSENAAAAPASCAKTNLSLVKDGLLSIGTDNPAFPPWFAGGETKGRPWKTSYQYIVNTIKPRPRSRSTTPTTSRSPR